MADGGGEDFAPSSFTDSLSSSTASSSSFSSTSVSESCSTEVTSGSEGDMPAFPDGGIYGWICSLIEQGKVARFVDRCEGIYELNWQDVIWKYWSEWRARRDPPNSVNTAKFDHRTASNTLRGALLNSYKDKGAKEYPEMKMMDNKNKTIKRCFRMPSTWIDKLTRIKHESHNKTAASTTMGSTTSESFSNRHITEQCSEALPSVVTSMDFSALDVDVEESRDLISYMLLPEHHIDDVTLPNDPHLMSTSSDEMATSQYDAGSSGYESAEENLVKEMDPCEGPYQGGNVSFIFLEQSLSSRSPGAGFCKVVFSSPKHSLIPREVTATVKNPFTIKVRVPHCPRLSGKQLAHDKLTVQVLVTTLEGYYIGETMYTYSTNLMAQFEQCVKALDDEDMELDFTGSPDQQLVGLNYKSHGELVPCCIHEQDMETFLKPEEIF